MLSWGVLGIAVSRPKSELKTVCCSNEGISGKFGNRVDLLNCSDWRFSLCISFMTAPDHLNVGSKAGGRKEGENMGEAVWKVVGSWSLLGR